MRDSAEQQLHDREVSAWEEYAETTKTHDEFYEDREPHAWHRLRTRLARIQRERRTLSGDHTGGARGVRSRAS